MLTSAARNVAPTPATHGGLRDRFYWRTVDDSLFVVDLNHFAFTVLNASAALLWLSLLDEQRSPEELATLLASSFGTDVAAVRPDVASTIAQWTDLGWISLSDAGTITISAQTTDQPPPPYRAVSRANFDRAVSATRVEWTIDCKLAGNPVSIHLLADSGLESSDISRRARSFLDGMPRAPKPSGSPILCHVTHTGIYLRLCDTCVHALDVSDGLSRLVLWAFYLCYGADNMLGTFHAAAVGRENGAILMPGQSGRGKSTLTAYLAANGWLYGGDDIIGLGRPAAKDDPRCLVLPFSSALSVKAASVPPLEPLYPGLGDLPELTYDTKRARFLRIPTDRQMGSDPDPRRIKAIVFPHFDPSTSPATVTPITTGDALLALAGVGYRTGEQMDARLLGGLLDFLETTHKYRLDFSDLAAADQCLRSLT